MLQTIEHIYVGSDNHCSLHGISYKQSGNHYFLHRRWNKYSSTKTQTIRWRNTCSDSFKPQSCATRRKDFIKNMNVLHTSYLKNLLAKTLKNIGLSAILASSCCYDIALRFTRRIRTSKKMLKTWPISGSCFGSLSSFLYITHLLASATISWKMSTRSLIEYCLTVVIQDPRIHWNFVINAWCIAATARFDCTPSFAHICLANWIMWRICSLGFTFEPVSTESAI